MARVVGGLLALMVGVVACGTDYDPCTESGGPTDDTPVACVAGADPTVLASIVTPSSAINTEVAFSKRDVVLDEGRAYWSDYSGRILRTPKQGGRTDTLHGPSDCSIAALAVDDVGIYFGENCFVPQLAATSWFPVEGHVRWISKSDGTEHDLMTMQEADVRELSVAGGVVYWVFSDELAAATLFAAPRAADAATPATSIAGTSGVFLTAAVNESAVVWYDSSARELRRIELPASGDELLAPAPNLESVILDASSAYFTTEDPVGGGRRARTLWQVPITGGTPAAVLGGNVTEHVATDGRAFFGAGFDTPDGDIVNRVYRWLPPRFEPEPVVAAIEWPQSIALDASSAFVIDESMGDPFTLRLIRLHR